MAGMNWDRVRREDKDARARARAYRLALAKARTKNRTGKGLRPQAVLANVGGGLQWNRRMTTCSWCGATVRSDRIEKHLRRVHAVSMQDAEPAVTLALGAAQRETLKSEMKGTVKARPRHQEVHGPSESASAKEIRLSLSPDVYDALLFAAKRLNLPTARTIRRALAAYLNDLDLPVDEAEAPESAATLSLRRRKTTTRKPSAKRKRSGPARRPQARPKARQARLPKATKRVTKKVGRVSSKRAPSKTSRPKSVRQRATPRTAGSQGKGRG